MIALAPTLTEEQRRTSGDAGTGYVRYSEPLAGITAQPATTLQPIALVEPTSESQTVVKALGDVLTQPAPQQTQQTQQTLQPTQQTVPSSGGGNVVVTTQEPAQASVFDWRMVPVWVWLLLALTLVSMRRKR